MHRRKQVADLLVSLRKIVGYNLPYPCRINAMIGVGDNIPESSHFVPGEARISGLHPVREIRGGLPDNLQGSFDGVAELAILQKVLQVVPLGEVAGVGHGFVNVGEILRLTAGHRMRNRMEEWRRGLGSKRARGIGRDDLHGLCLLPDLFTDCPLEGRPFAEVDWHIQKILELLLQGNEVEEAHLTARLRVLEVDEDVKIAVRIGLVPEPRPVKV